MRHRGVVDAKRGGNATLGVSGIAFSGIGLRQDDDRASLGQRERGTKARNAAAYHQEIATHAHPSTPLGVTLKFSRRATHWYLSGE